MYGVATDRDRPISHKPIWVLSGNRASPRAAVCDSSCSRVCVPIPAGWFMAGETSTRVRSREPSPSRSHSCRLDAASAGLTALASWSGWEPRPAEAGITSGFPSEERKP